MRKNLSDDKPTIGSLNTIRHVKESKDVEATVPEPAFQRAIDSISGDTLSNVKDADVSVSEKSTPLPALSDKAKFGDRTNRTSPSKLRSPVPENTTTNTESDSE